MKKIFLSLGILAISNAMLGQTGFNDPRCPVFHRNNGNAGGCDSKITLFFPTCPATPVYLIGILDGNNPVTGLTFNASTCNNGRIDVCVTGGNLPPSSQISLLFSDQPNGNLLFACTRVPNAGPTPVRIGTFNTKRTNNNVGISWSTEFEDNIKSFIIQRKTGSSFQDVGTVAASNIVTGGNYSFSDNNLSKVSSQYRLKVVDFDGSYTLSDIRNVRGTAGAIDFIVYPNPSVGSLKVNITDMEAAYDVELVDNTGRVFQRVSASGSGTVELTNIPKGIHLVRIVNKSTGETVTKKITVI